MSILTSKVPILCLEFTLERQRFLLRRILNPWVKLECPDNEYQVGKLVKEGFIEAPYSVHDLRHHYVIEEYMKDNDIYRLKVLLNHASIMVTENYLRGIENHWK